MSTDPPPTGRPARRPLSKKVRPVAAPGSTPPAERPPPERPPPVDPPGGYDRRPWAAYTLGYASTLVPAVAAGTPARLAGWTEAVRRPARALREACLGLSNRIPPTTYAELNRVLDELAEPAPGETAAGLLFGTGRGDRVPLADRLRMLAANAAPDEPLLRPWADLGRRLGGWIGDDLSSADPVPLLPVAVAAQAAVLLTPPGTVPTVTLLSAAGAADEAAVRAVLHRDLVPRYRVYDRPLPVEHADTFLAIAVQRAAAEVGEELWAWPRLSEPTARHKPVWTRGTGELRYGGAVVKRLVVGKAVNVAAVLDAFEAADWPQWLVVPGVDELRLHPTLASLNQRLAALRFRSDGAGEGIVWEVLPTRR